MKQFPQNIYITQFEISELKSSISRVSASYIIAFYTNSYDATRFEFEYYKNNPSIRMKIFNLH